MSDKEDSTHEKSDEVEDLNDEEKKKIADDEVSHISHEAAKKYVTNEFKEKVIGYMKIDDMIRKRTEEIKELKNKKKPCEEYIIRFLEKEDAGFVNVNGGKLVKNETETKGPLKAAIIKEAIKEGMQIEKLVSPEDIEKCNRITEDIFELMEKKRPVQKRVNLRRTFAGRGRGKK